MADILSENVEVIANVIQVTSTMAELSTRNPSASSSTSNSNNSTNGNGTNASTPVPYHPAYSSVDADIVLQSSDGVRFRVHTFIMRLASEFFRTMLDIPQDPYATGNGPPISMEEHSSTIEAMLDIIYPNRAVPRISSFQMASSLLGVAEKYDIQSIRNTVWTLVTDPPFRCGALETFVLACRYGSEKEAKAASTATLEIDLYAPESLKVLETLDHASHLKLRNLHTTRRQMLLKAMNIRYDFVYFLNERVMQIRSNSSNRHFQDCVMDFNPPAWLALKYLVSVEMEKCSAGTTLRGPFWNRTEFEDVWATNCARCNKPVLEKDYFILEFMRILDLLPKTI